MLIRRQDLTIADVILEGNNLRVINHIVTFKTTVPSEVTSDTHNSILNFLMIPSITVGAASKCLWDVVLDHRASDGKIDYLTNGRVTSRSDNDSDGDTDTVVINQLQDEKSTTIIQPSPVGP